MKFVKKLKVKSIIGAILLAAVCLGFAALFLAVSDVSLFWQEPRNLHDVPREELEGAYVTVELPYIYGEYAYTEEYENDSDKIGTVVSREYIIDANYNDYCGLLVENKEMLSNADALLEQTYQYNYYEIDEITATFTVTGVMEKMPSDSLRFYHEVVEYDTLSAAEQEIYLPLYLNVRDNSEVIQSIVFAVISAVLTIIALVMLIRAFTGTHQKQILKKAEQLSPNAPEAVLDQVDQLRQELPKEKVRFNSRILFAENGNNSRLYAMSELVWVYQSTTTQRVYFIPVGKTHALVLAMDDGKRVQIPMKEAKVKEYMQNLYQANPRCFFGYSADIDKLYRKNPTALLQNRTV